MKPLLVLSLVACAFIAIRCDVIEAPYRNTTTVDTNSQGTVVRKVFLEEFTGVTCKNCPDGHRAAEELRKALGSKLITMAIHAGDFAEPTKSYPNDFRTTAGTEMNSQFKVTSYPAGMINRTKVSGSWIIGRGGWGGQINTELAKEAEVKLTLTPTYDATSKNLQLKVSSELLKDEAKKLYLALYVVEDSVQAPQLDGNVRDSLYWHRDMLRDAPIGTYGEALTTDAAPAKTKVEKTYNYAFNGTKSSTWKVEHCKVIAIVHTNTPDYNILQVEEVHVK